MCFCLIVGDQAWGDDEFVSPKSPLLVEGAPSEKVTNGHLFESGSLVVPKERELVFPKTAVVEEYNGTSLRFFVTKSMHCMGHPPSPMRIADARNYYGIAYQMNEEDCIFSTFGEWGNRGGSAVLKILVLVPRGQRFRKAGELTGVDSLASSPMNFKDEALKKCYWYAGTGPKEKWKRVNMELHYNRFLKPE